MVAFSLYKQRSKTHTHTAHESFAKSTECGRSLLTAREGADQRAGMPKMQARDPSPNRITDNYSSSCAAGISR